MAIHFILIVGKNEATINYRNAVMESGHIPIVTDNLKLLDESRQNQDMISQSTLSRMNLLLLPGGGDISPDLLQVPDAGSRDIDRNLDLVQFAYLEYFLSKKLPIIGICKGMQLINARFGGTLIQDMPLSNRNIHAYLQCKDNQHSCTYTPSEKFSGFPNLVLLKKLYHTKHLPSQINSAHHQCVDRLAHELIPFQYASDGILEGYIHHVLPIIGLQWHPERLFYENGCYLKLFLSLLLN